jgi:hypothetical protein
MATENDLKYLLNTYQKKAMDLFTQLVVAETKLEQALAKIVELEDKIKKYESDSQTVANQELYN